MTDSPPYYAFFYFGLAIVSSLSLVIPPLHTKRKTMGRAGYTYREYLRDAKEFDAELSQRKPRCYQTDPSAPPNAWWCQRIRLCYPWDHLLYRRIVYTATLTIVHSVHFKYYLNSWFGEGRIGDRTDSQVFFCLGIAFLCNMFVCCLGPVSNRIQDGVFAITFWATVGIWIVKRWGDAIPMGGEIALIAGFSVLALLLVGFCIFFMSFCMCGLCLACCKSDHSFSKAMLRVQYHAVTAIAITLGYMLGTTSIAYYDESDHWWLDRNAIAAATIFAFGYIWRFVVCSKHDSNWGKFMRCIGCNCLADCYDNTYDQNKHLPFRMLANVSGSSGKPKGARPRPLMGTSQPHEVITTIEDIEEEEETHSLNLDDDEADDEPRRLTVYPDCMHEDENSDETNDHTDD